MVSWLWLVVEASTDRRTLIVDFESTANPLYQAWRWLLPDLRAMGTADLIGTGFWAIVLAVLVAVVLRSHAARPSPGGHNHVTAAE